jgi:hypothetical protein
VAFLLVRLAVFAPFVVGFALAARGFLGHAGRCAKRLRLGAWIGVGGGAAGLVLSMLDLIIDSPAADVARVAGLEIAAAASFLFSLVAYVLLAQAFGPKTFPSRRSRFLAWAAVIYGGGSFVVWLWRSVASYFPVTYALNVDALIQAALWASATAVAAVAFFRAARPARPGTLGHLARREGRLALAASLVTLAAGFRCVSWIVSYSRVWGSLHWWSAWWDWWEWLSFLSVVACAVAAGLAARGFFLSRRTARALDNATAAPTTSVGH